MFKTENLTFEYKGSNKSFSFPNISLEKREELLILGKSGIGKTTLLHLLAGILKPTYGAVNYDEVNIGALSNSQLDSFRGQNVGLVFQNNHAIKSLSVLDNIKARLHFSKRPIRNSVINELLKELGLEEYKHQKVNQLSEGQLQRLGIALAVVHQPKVIFADEPTSSLDDENCKVVIELLKRQAKHSNANLIVITHDNRIKSLFTKTIDL